MPYLCGVVAFRKRLYISQNCEEGTERKGFMTGNKSMVNGKPKINQDAMEGLNETQ